MTAPMTSREELLACPFCGKEPTLDEHPPSPGDDDSFVVIRCCGFSKEYSFASNAIKWWNTRAVPAQGASIVPEAKFLLDRLQEFDPGDFDAERDFHGHVAPAIARLRNALSALPSTDREGI